MSPPAVASNVPATSTMPPLKVSITIPPSDCRFEACGLEQTESGVLAQFLTDHDVDRRARACRNDVGRAQEHRGSFGHIDLDLAARYGAACYQDINRVDVNVPEAAVGAILRGNIDDAALIAARSIDIERTAEDGAAVGVKLDITAIAQAAERARAAGCSRVNAKRRESIVPPWLAYTSISPPPALPPKILAAVSAVAAGCVAAQCTLAGEGQDRKVGREIRVGNVDVDIPALSGATTVNARAAIGIGFDGQVVDGCVAVVLHRDEHVTAIG